MLTQFRQTFQKQWALRCLRFVKNRPTSLTHKTLMNMALRVMAVVLVSAGVSYVHVMSRLETQTQTQLEKYISGRGEQESSIFQLAQDNLALLRDRLLLELKQPTNIDFQAEFERQYLFWNDGTRRNLSGSIFSGTMVPAAIFLKSDRSKTLIRLDMPDHSLVEMCKSLKNYSNVC